LKVEPLDGPTNGISTCVKGKFGWDFVNSPDRLTKPLIREGGKFREASWDEALDLVARKFCGDQSKERSGFAGVCLFPLNAPMKKVISCRRLARAAIANVRKQTLRRGRLAVA